MDVYLAGSYSRPFVHEEIKNDQNMQIYLAGVASGNNNKIWKDNALDNPSEPQKIFSGDSEHKISILESFYYMTDWMVPYIRDHWDFLLDSGAFTFMNDKKNANGVVWDEYLERYAQFINDNDVKLFFELDIDAVVGIKEVERLRAKLEKLTNKQSIPVWHKSRGKEYWFRMIQEYGYVALGGMVSGGVAYKDKVEKMFPWFLQTAKEQDCKVHGLGYTSIKGMQKFKFHSVDSTAWLYGNRGGFLYYFNGIELVKEDKPNGTRLKAREAAVHNFREWVKFQKYAKTNL